MNFFCIAVLLVPSLLGTISGNYSDTTLNDSTRATGGNVFKVAFKNQDSPLEMPNTNGYADPDGNENGEAGYDYSPDILETSKESNNPTISFDSTPKTAVLLSGSDSNGRGQAGNDYSTNFLETQEVKNNDTISTYSTYTTEREETSAVEEDTLFGSSNENSSLNINDTTQGQDISSVDSDPSFRSSNDNSSRDGNNNSEAAAPYQTESLRSSSGNYHYKISDRSTITTRRDQISTTDSDALSESSNDNSSRDGNSNGKAAVPYQTESLRSSSGNYHYKTSDRSTITTRRDEISTTDSDALSESSNDNATQDVYDGGKSDGLSISDILRKWLKKDNSTNLDELLKAYRNHRLHFMHKDAHLGTFSSQSTPSEDGKDGGQVGYDNAKILQRRDALNEINCQTPHKLKNSQLDCIVTRGKVLCNQTCNYGFTHREGIVRLIECKFWENIWKPSDEDCKPFVNCGLKIYGPGGYKCNNDIIDKGPTCEIFCGAFWDKEAVEAETYICDMDAKWTPELPFCASNDPDQMLVRPPTGLNTTLNWYWHWHWH